MTHLSFDSLISTCQTEWDNYVQHDFIKQLADGSLDKSCFQHYLKQDYLFLIHFARAWGLAVYKSNNIFEIREALGSLKAIVDVELDLHVQYCQEWGITEHQLSLLPEAKSNIAYTRYVLDVGNQGQLLDIHVALAPCLIGYGKIANWINQQAWRLQTNNPYQSWIDMYASDEYQRAMLNEIAWINQQLVGINQDRFNQLAKIFKNATVLEADFWLMGLTKSY